jgi:hypothetical protein
MNELELAVVSVINGHESAYTTPSVLTKELNKLIQYAIDKRDERHVDEGDAEASMLISKAIASLGFSSDINVGRDLWELVSEDSQAQWLYPPEDQQGVVISLVNVAQNMATSQCYIEFT